MMNSNKKLMVRNIIQALVITAVLFSNVSSREISLVDALNIATQKSSRSEIISGDLEVAEQSYHAEKINFYLPEISINGNLPVYNVNESFSNIYGIPGKSLVKRTNLNYNANIDLRQSLITGGELIVKSELVDNKADLPQATSEGILEDITQRTQQGVFDFSFTQPLLKPSQPKNTLRNKRDDLEIARLTRVEEMTSLENEVIEAYFGVLRAQLEFKISEHKAESAKEQARIDSIKFSDKILSEEEYLESASLLLDAELNHFDAENLKIQINRDMALLLDLDINEQIEAKVPEITGYFTEQEIKNYINNWDQSIPVIKAEYNYYKADREADYTASSHGLTGTFNANYTIGRGEFTSKDITEDNNTDSWGMSVNFTFPLWDGGSAGAAIKAARLNAKKSELELERVKKSEKAQLVNLVNQIDISFQKIDVLQKQVGLASEKLKIAQYRYEDGQISMLEYLESKIYYLEAQKKYIEELKEFFKNKNLLEGKYPV